jgi:hypothetical protein
MARPTKEQAAAKLAAQQAGQPTTELTEVEQKPLTPEQRFEALEAHCLKLEEAISRIAVLTGNGNHLRELGIERWVPGKKHMNKKYA